MNNGDGEPQVHIHVENGPWTDTLQKTETDIFNYLDRETAEYPTDEDFRYQLFGQFKLDQEITLVINELTREDRSWEIDLKKEAFDPEAEDDDDDETFFSPILDHE